MQVARPVVFAVGIIMIVYLPILSLAGSRGRCSGRWPHRRLRARRVAGAGAHPDAGAGDLFLRKGVGEGDRGSSAGRTRSTTRCSMALGAPRDHGRVAVLVLLVSRASRFLGAEFVPRLDEGAIAMQIAAAVGVARAVDPDHDPRRARVADEFRRRSTRSSRRPAGRRSRPIRWGWTSPTSTSCSTPTEKWRTDRQGGTRRRDGSDCREAVPGPSSLHAADRAADQRADRRRALGCRHQLYGDDLASSRRRRTRSPGVSRRCPAPPT